MRHFTRLSEMLGPDGAVQMQSIARLLHRIFEARCNGFHNEASEKRADARETRLENMARALADSHGYRVYVQRDPRGAPLYLYKTEDVRMGGIESCYSSIGTVVY